MMLDHVHIACARHGCHATITVHEDEYRRLRRTGERFYCPSGHQSFYDPQPKTDPELSRARREANELRSLVSTYHHGADVCPLGCGWQANRWMRGWISTWTPRIVRQYLDRVGRDLSEHLIRDHGASPSTRKLIPERTGDAQ